MNTPAHLLIGTAAFARAGHRRVTRAAFAGALLPDLSLYLMAGISLFVLGIPPARVFGELYYSDAWQTVFAIDNSFVLWGGGLALALWFRRPALVAFAGAGCLHLAFDFPLHHDDARAHFWPLTGWRFESPVSYWDSAHHARIVAPFAVALATGAAILLWRRFADWPIRAFALAALAAELWVARQWILFF